MNTRALKQFAQDARRQLREQVAARMAQVLGTDSVEIREQEKAVEELERQIKATSPEAVIDTVAYTWFNRFCALRFMDVNHYTRLGIVSPVAGYTQPEILQEAKQGVIDESFPVDHQRVFDLLGGQIPAAHPQQEAYRLLLVGACNGYHKQMGFLFEPIADYTELLMPGDLLSENSILQAIRNALTPETCRDVEVIGWLYQYYISERKDEVFANLKKRQKIQSEDIPAATQLFTPHWIVRYLVENSLGRLWLLNRPHSRLAESMDYYIQPEEQETDYLRLNSPEELKLCDPACGSGHMLTYSFDLLYRIYEEEGYDPVQIPQLILDKNLYGIEIDQRAGALAAFALTMKARAKDRRFFRRQVTPNICVLENVRFTAAEINEYMDAVGRDLFTNDLWLMLKQFEAADNFGSLIRPQVQDVGYIRQRLAEQGIFDDLFLHATNQKVKTVLKQAKYLSPRYHVVVANPPYMGSRGMNKELKDFAKDHYPDSKRDSCTMFIERNAEMVQPGGQVGMITMQSWMFLSSFEKLRTRMLSQERILSMAHLGPRAFDSIGGEVVSTTSFVIQHSPNQKCKGTYLRLIDGTNEAEKAAMLHQSLPANNQPLPANCYTASAADFKKIPGSPIAYWVSDTIRDVFSNSRLENDIITDGQNKTADNEKYVRFIWEVNRSRAGKNRKWLLYAKGGSFRKWYGNLEHLVNWSKEARQHYRKSTSGRIIDQRFWYQEGITWTDITSTGAGFRYLPKDTTFDMAGPTAFFSSQQPIGKFICLLNSVFAITVLPVLNPTLHAQLRDVKNIPKPSDLLELVDLEDFATKCISLARVDWDSYEASWDFVDLPLLRLEFQQKTLGETYAVLRTKWQEMTEEMQQLEEENNRIFIEAYGLQDELTPDVPLSEITLTCNPHYRYRGKKSDEELEALLLADTMREFISYAVGCMFGRYSLDKPGLILANQGETGADYRAQIPNPAFPPDDDNVIPILDEGWFSDDVTARFKTFLRLTFGDEHYEENLAFLEEAIGKDIRSYLLKDFYKDHVKTYKKRPIYWLFSSPKGSFNALIYMHRYRPDTVSVVLNDYLREYRVKLDAHQAHLEQVSISGDRREKTQALKALGRINKILIELKEYEDEILYPLATRRIEIDLDDGVKANYPKFGQALKKL